MLVAMSADRPAKKMACCAVALSTAAEGEPGPWRLELLTLQHTEADGCM
jgi:hypothetical protein